MWCGSVSSNPMDRQDKTNVLFSQLFCMSPKNEVALPLMIIMCPCLGTSFDIVINGGVR